MEKLKALFFVLTCLLLAVPCSADIIYVDADASPGGNGQTWGTAYKYLQDALTDAAVSGKDIWVAAGIYKPDDDDAHHPNGTGLRTDTFQLINGVAIYGGYAGFGEPDPNARDVKVYETILSGDINTPGDNSDNSYHVVTGSGTDPNAVLNGFTITAGNADGPYPQPTLSGAGMYNETGSPTVTNCTFSDNLAYYYGSGMYNHKSNPTATNCTFSGNYGGGGGGMCNYASSPTVTKCTFSGNSAGWGGGMGNNGLEGECSPTVTDCTFSGNAGRSYGGGMYNYYTSPTITNCTFSRNSADLKNGGGMYNSSSNPTVTNCTFSGNTADYDGGGMHNGGGSPTVVNCTFSGNSAEEYGGGMENHYSSPTVTNCTFNGNSAYVGGGMFNERSSPTVTNCMFSGNSCNYGGGGMANDYYCSPTMTNCTFSGNRAGNHGGGMANWKFCNPCLVNCTFSGNEAGNQGGGINNWESNSKLTNCILWGDTPEEIYVGGGGNAVVTYSDVQGGWSGPGGNNFNADPLFVDADGADDSPGTEDDNLRLSAGSLCIDAGDSNSVPADTIDLDDDGNTTERIPLDLNGFRRFIDDLCTTDTGNGTPPIVDMGAYEFLRSDINSNGNVNFMDFAELATHWLETACGVCGGADLTCDGNVDSDDLREFCNNWLTGL